MLNFHCHNGYANATQYYVLCIVHILYDVVPSTSPPVTSSLTFKFSSQNFVYIYRVIHACCVDSTASALFTSNGTPYDTKCVDVSELQ